MELLYYNTNRRKLLKLASHKLFFKQINLYYIKILDQIIKTTNDEYLSL